jgi:hypothetical protein
MEYKVGDEVQWIICGRGSMQKVTGQIHDIKDGVARCRRGKRGKKDYMVPLREIIRPGYDPLKSFVRALAEAHQEEKE